MKPRMTIEECQERIGRIRKSLLEHIGKRILLIVRDGRAQMPMIAKLSGGENGKVFATYRNFSKSGSPRGTRSMLVNPALVHTGELKLEFFDDGV